MPNIAYLRAPYFLRRLFAGQQEFTFTLPASLPSGQYLIRVEQIALHVASTYGGAQFYIGCAQVNVVNGGNGNPGPLVSIPGVYTGVSI